MKKKSPVAERIDMLMEPGESLMGMSKRLDISYQSLYKIYRGERNMGAKIAKIIADGTGCDFDWILKGKGGSFVERGHNICGGFIYAPVGRIFSIPVLTLEKAGEYMKDPSKNPSELAVGQVYSDLPGDNLFAIKICDNSMEPDFQIGDIIIINPSAEIKSGDFVVAIAPGSDAPVFRKIQFAENTAILKALNSKFDDTALFDRKELRLMRATERKTQL